MNSTELYKTVMHNTDLYNTVMKSVEMYDTVSTIQTLQYSSEHYQTIHSSKLLPSIMQVPILASPKPC